MLKATKKSINKQKHEINVIDSDIIQYKKINTAGHVICVSHIIITSESFNPTPRLRIIEDKKRSV